MKRHIVKNILAISACVLAFGMLSGCDEYEMTLEQGVVDEISARAIQHGGTVQEGYEYKCIDNAPNACATDGSCIKLSGSCASESSGGDCNLKNYRFECNESGLFGTDVSNGNTQSSFYEVKSNVCSSSSQGECDSENTSSLDNYTFKCNDDNKLVGIEGNNEDNPKVIDSAEPNVCRNLDDYIYACGNDSKLSISDRNNNILREVDNVCPESAGECPPVQPCATCSPDEYSFSCENGDLMASDNNSNKTKTKNPGNACKAENLLGDYQFKCDGANLMIKNKNAIGNGVSVDDKGDVDPDVCVDTETCNPSTERKRIICSEDDTVMDVLVCSRTKGNKWESREEEKSKVSCAKEEPASINPLDGYDQICLNNDNGEGTLYKWVDNVGYEKIEDCKKGSNKVSCKKNGKTCGTCKNGSKVSSNSKVCIDGGDSNYTINGAGGGGTSSSECEITIAGTPVILSVDDKSCTMKNSICFDYNYMPNVTFHLLIKKDGEVGMCGACNSDHTGCQQ